MPLLPIDQQVIFSNMDHVGKEQSVAKNGVIESQAVQANEIVKKTEEKDNSVNETKDVEEGLQKIREREERQKKKQEEKNKKEREKQNKKEIVSDPDLGQNIDISG